MQPNCNWGCLGDDMIANNNRQIDTIVSFLKENFSNLVAVYLYGSSAKGNKTQESDIDIAILTNNKTEPLEFWQRSQELAQLLKTDVDLVDLKAASTVMQFQIIFYGKRIYTQSQGQSELFENMILSKYMLFNEERSEYLKAIKETGKFYHDR